jgi:predicted Fe-S protein YdhL (DUF1289 family)
MSSTDFASLPCANLAQRAAAAVSTRPVPSPCCQVCRIEPGRGRCAGCLRTLDEIAAWPQLDDAAKRAVWAALPARVEASPP